MKKIATLITAAVLCSACSPEPGSQNWCEDKKAQPKSEWSSEDAMTFTKHCLLEGSTIGSEKWCEDLAEKPKGEWSANEATDYAKHCVI